MVGEQGVHIAAEICKMLESQPEALSMCLRALKDAQDGQMLLSDGDSSGALPLLRRAHDRFESIQEARLLLGINKADLAAAYGNIGRYEDAIAFAEDSLSIVEGVRRLTFTEAMARMTLGNSYGVQGKRSESAKELKRAEDLLRALPGCERYLAALEMNRSALSQIPPRTQDRYLSRWLLLLIVVAGTIAAIAHYLRLL